MGEDDGEFRMFPKTEAEWMEVERFIREGDALAAAATRQILEGTDPERSKTLKRAIALHTKLKRRIRKFRRLTRTKAG